MADHSNAYAVARIRVLENSLLTQSDIDQLMACKTYESCLAFLTDKGWGTPDHRSDAQNILRAEREKIWDLIRDMKVDMATFDVLACQNLYHNLKAAVKETVTGPSPVNVYYEKTAIPKEEMLRIVYEKDFEKLPEHMQEAAAEALKVMLQTRDGQLCDIIVDRALLEAVRQMGKSSGSDMIWAYAENFVSSADMKIAFRAAKTGKTKSFLDRALAECDLLDLDKLSMASVSGFDAICEYLSETGFSEAVDAAKESNSAFERWCDNRILACISPQKYNPFTTGPLIAYVLARENEISTVRMILTWKKNKLPEESIRERIRVIYV